MDGFNSELESIRGALQNTLGERLCDIPGTDPNRFDLLEPEGGDILKELTEVVQGVLGPNNTESQNVFLGKSIKNGSKTILISVNYQGLVLFNGSRKRYFITQMFTMNK